MNKYILMLGVAGVALGSYAAYAGNSATMTVTATIAHDVSINIEQEMSCGTITIDPSQSFGAWDCNDDDTSKNGGVMSKSGTRIGKISANVPASGWHWTITKTDFPSPLAWAGGTPVISENIQSDGFYHVYAYIEYNTVPAEDDYSATITVSYTPES
ncbi:MAG: hypothetical protein IJ689_00775 [Alphaproteobacteria bacterium]|nr:hypothetical protein [Alphaproteobacteria bacterium]